MSRLMHRSKLSLFRSSINISRNRRFFSSGSDNSASSKDSAKTDRIEETQSIHFPPPPTEKLLLLGGNGFVGSHVCKEALSRSFTVASLGRSGRSLVKEPWADSLTWHQGNLFSTNSWKDALKEISCVGGFGSNSEMYKINGTANINAIRAASEEGTSRAAETELLTRYPYGGVILRPGFIHGTRHAGSMRLPLGLIGSPLEMVLQHAKPLTQVPLVGPLFTPPIDVNAVAKVAVRVATDPVFPPGIVDVYGILRYSQPQR